MLNYGAYSQRHFGNGDNIECDPDAIASVTASTINKPYQSGDDIPSEVVLAGTSLSLESNLTMSLYFRISGLQSAYLLLHCSE